MESNHLSMFLHLILSDYPVIWIIQNVIWIATHNKKISLYWARNWFDKKSSITKRFIPISNIMTKKEKIKFIITQTEILYGFQLKVGSFYILNKCNDTKDKLKHKMNNTLNTTTTRNTYLWTLEFSQNKRNHYK